jgi:Flp pilus assembly protein TadG
MRTRARAFSFRRLPRRFADDRRGSAAAEFCIILPVILTFTFGVAEVCSIASVSRKLTLTAHAMSDMVAQATSIDDAGIQNVMAAGKLLLRPFPADADLKLRVSAVNIDANKQATVQWSDAQPASEKRAGAVTIPPALLVPNTQLIWGEVSYKYKPNYGPFSLLVAWPFEYEHYQFFARPRESSTVCRSSCS